MTSELRLLEAYGPDALVRDVLARKPLRISVPESLTGFVRMANLDWSREVEIPPRDLLDDADLERLVRDMASLQQRFIGLQSLVYRQRGRILYTMLGGTRYAARVEWNTPAGNS